MNYFLKFVLAISRFACFWANLGADISLTNFAGDGIRVILTSSSVIVRFRVDEPRATTADWWREKNCLVWPKTAEFSRLLVKKVQIKDQMDIGLQFLWVQYKWSRDPSFGSCISTDVRNVYWPTVYSLDMLCIRYWFSCYDVLADPVNAPDVPFYVGLANLITMNAVSNSLVNYQHRFVRLSRDQIVHPKVGLQSIAVQPLLSKNPSPGGC